MWGDDRGNSLPHTDKRQNSNPPADDSAWLADIYHFFGGKKTHTVPPEREREREREREDGKESRSVVGRAENEALTCNAQHNNTNSSHTSRN